MKGICIRDINYISQNLNKLFSVIEDRKPDIIMCFGGLFIKNKELPNEEEQKSNLVPILKKKVPSKQVPLSETTLKLEQLAIFNLPVIIIPNMDDLEQKQSIKRAKNTESLLYRWLIDNQFTTIEGWSFIGFSNKHVTPMFLEHDFFESKVIWCFTTDPQTYITILRDLKTFPDFLIYSDEYEAINFSPTICLQLPSLDSKKLLIVDFDNKTHEQINL